MFYIFGDIVMVVVVFVVVYWFFEMVLVLVKFGLVIYGFCIF